MSGSMKKNLQPADYLKKILTARVYDVAIESALEPAKNLSRRLHNRWGHSRPASRHRPWSTRMRTSRRTRGPPGLRRRALDSGQVKMPR